jgi:5-bromo-4-chloroindolyl phosphate hydrolysis protein
MKSLSFLLILINFSYQSTTNVYICNSGKTDKYHLKQNCRGLSNCQYKIVKTTLEKAKKDKKTLCKWEE